MSQSETTQDAGPLGFISPLIASLLTPFVFNTLLFLIAQLKEDNSIVDIGWSLLFILSNLTFLLLQDETITSRQILLIVLVTVWGLRLAGHIGLRHKGVEDFRYQSMRRRWFAKGGQSHVYLMAFLYVFTMQAFISLLINASTLYTIYKESFLITPSLGLFDYLGIAVFTIGFLMETVSDQ